MKRELHVRFCEGGGVKLPSATRCVPSMGVNRRWKSSGGAGRSDPEQLAR